MLRQRRFHRRTMQASKSNATFWTPPTRTGKPSMPRTSEGPFWVCKHGAAAMLRLGRGGSIVDVASVLSICADPMLTAYTTSKHAVPRPHAQHRGDPPLARAESAPTRCCPETWTLRWCSSISPPTRTLRKRAARSVRAIRSNASPIPPRLRMSCDSCFRRRIVCQRGLDRRRRRTGRCALHQSLIRPSHRIRRKSGVRHGRADRVNVAH